uniref:Uncharacterized protein n=1 Tax=Arundo donax TaxID=35708 RepID=A0A0A9A6M6_ARUDO
MLHPSGQSGPINPPCMHNVPFVV